MSTSLARRGIDITGASYIFLMEPCADAGQEMQTIKRAHRIGQNQDVFVERLILAGSIEEQIASIQTHPTDGSDKALAEQHRRTTALLLQLKPIGYAFPNEFTIDNA